MGFVQQPVNMISIFCMKEESPSINATCECAAGEILPHHSHNNLLFHFLNCNTASVCFLPFCLNVSLLLSLKSSLELFSDFWQQLLC